MAVLQLDLAEPVLERLNENAVAGNYPSVSAYVADLVGRAVAREDSRIAALLREGLASGPPITVDDEFWNQQLRRLEEARTRNER